MHGNLRMTDPKALAPAATRPARGGQPILSSQAAPSPERSVWPLKQVGKEGEKNKQKPAIAVYTEVRSQVVVVKCLQETGNILNRDACQFCAE